MEDFNTESRQSSAGKMAKIAAAVGGIMLIALIVSHVVSTSLFLSRVNGREEEAPEEGGAGKLLAAQIFSLLHKKGH